MIILLPIKKAMKISLIREKAMRISLIEENFQGKKVFGAHEIEI